MNKLEREILVDELLNEYYMFIEERNGMEEVGVYPSFDTKRYDLVCRQIHRLQKEIDKLSVRV